MVERQTTSIVTPAGNTIVLNSYLTGREAAEIKAVQYSAVKMTMSDVESKKFDAPSFSGASMVDKELKEVAMLLVSINGDTEKPMEKLLDLPSTEYDAVLAEVQKIKDPTKPESSEPAGIGTSQTAQ